MSRLAGLGDPQGLETFHQTPSDPLRDLRDDRVAESPQSVHPSGNPMSHSTHVGLSCPPTEVLNAIPPCEYSCFRDPVSLETGVGYSPSEFSRTWRKSSLPRCPAR